MSTDRDNSGPSEAGGAAIHTIRKQRIWRGWRWILVLLACGSSLPAHGADDAIRRSAQQLMRATVTIRAAGSEDFVARAAGSRDEPDGAAPAPVENEVTVCSGTFVGEGRLLSFGCLPVLSENNRLETDYRITFPAGGQAVASPRVVDRHSGLVLLELTGPDVDMDGLTALELAPRLPETGESVLTAAAAGVELPLVSLGLLSGVDRVVPGTDLPPLLVCDISTTPASSGAAVVDREARLVGIIAAASLPGESFGWSYAIPVKHIRRVLDAVDGDRLVILPRLRPNLGVVLGPGDQVGTVVVQHVTDGGPGDQASLSVGDRVLAIEGSQVRSVYQAGMILRKHLPGERITLTCVAPSVAAGGQLRPGTRPRQVEVTLGSQVDELTASPAEVQQQTIKARIAGPRKIELSNSARSYEYSLGSAAGAAEIRGGVLRPAAGGEFQAKLEQYEQLIRTLQEEADQTRQQLVKREQMVQALQEELSRLRREVDQSPAERK